VVAEQDEELRVEGDLMVLLNVNTRKATLYRTLETYIEPSQGIIDKWHYAERPYWVNPETHMFRMLEEVETIIAHDDDDIRQLFDSIPPL
jgi:Fe2+ or Zn2+ uptake regulation protein